MPGFENVPGIVAAAVALRAMAAEAAHESSCLSELVDRIRRTVPEIVADVEVIGEPVERAPPS